MFASMRSKKKSRDAAPQQPGGSGGKTDQQQQRKDVMAEPLKVPSPLKRGYYPGTQMPLDGWYHACR